MTEHTNRQFSTDLETTKSLFLQMGGLVETMVYDGVETLISGDLSLVDRVREREKEVNRLEVEIDERIGLIIARNQPTAGDLRLLLSVSKMLTDMERCGDEAEKIAKVARRLHEANSLYEPVVELRHMAKSVSAMIRNMLDSFARQDPVHPATVVRSDKEVDKEWKAALRHVITSMTVVPPRISGSTISRVIASEREDIAAQDKNMTARDIHTVTGDDVRHTDLEYTEPAARDELASQAEPPLTATSDTAADQAAD